MFQEKPEGYFDAILMDIMMPVMYISDVCASNKKASYGLFNLSKHSK